MLNPYIMLAVAALLIGSHGVVAFKSYRLGQDQVISEQVKMDQLEQRTREAAMQTAAEAIAAIEVRNVTIRQKAETITREVPVYRDCVHGADGLRLINEALLTGRQLTNPSELSEADTVGR